MSNSSTGRRRSELPSVALGEGRRVRSVDIKTCKLGATPTKLFKGPSGHDMLEQKENFLNHGKLPNFSEFEKNKVLKSKAKGEVRFEYFALSRHILEKVREDHMNGEWFMREAFGESVDKEEATRLIRDYLDSDPILATIKVIWSEDINSSAVMITRSMPNHPDKAKYTMLLKDDPSNPYLRERGITALSNHEVGTHFVRFYNDALQPWSVNRTRFKLRKKGTLTGIQTEEGLATLATLYSAKRKYLYKAALHYYAACMSTVMQFRELYDHIQGLEPDPETRWRLVYRIKRSLDAGDVGGYGKDQCYLAGAVKVLMNRRKLNFPALFSGKLCYDEVDKIKRVARLEGTLKPPFLSNMTDYMQHLDYVASLNDIDNHFSSFLQCPTIKVPSACHHLHRVRPVDFLPLSPERRKELCPDSTETTPRESEHSGETTNDSLHTSNENTSSNKGSVLTPSNTGSVLTPSNMGSVLTTSNTGSVLAPSNMGSVLTPSNMGSVLTPSNMDSVLTPSNMGSVLTTSKQYAKVASEDTDGSLMSRSTGELLSEKQVNLPDINTGRAVVKSAFLSQRRLPSTAILTTSKQ